MSRLGKKVRQALPLKSGQPNLQCLYKWIQLQQEEMTKAGESNVELIIDHYVQHILPLVRYKFKPLFLPWTKKFIVSCSIQIRFAMMTSSQLAQLLLNPLSVTHTDLLLRRARIGIASPFTTNATMYITIQW